MADATSVFNEISGALDALASQIQSSLPDDRNFIEMWGWNQLPMNRADLADYVRRPKQWILRLQTSSVSDDDFVRLQAFPARIELLKNSTVPNVGGNTQAVFTAMVGMVEALDLILSKYYSPPFDLQALESNKFLPAQQIKKLRQYELGIQRLGVESADLEKKVRAISSAHDVAQALPADIQMLEDARGLYEAAEKRLLTLSASATKTLEDIQKVREQILARNDEAARVLERANAAYSAATTVGLGKAFAERAKELSDSTKLLGIILLATLAAGAAITFVRVEFVHNLMMKPNVDFNVLWLNVTFTALSVSAPVWLAWLLTRQIGQRFRLAEDYGYKASVAKAYEGYRAEAAHIDQDLAKRLFSIALDTVGEAPLRLVEKDSPGSPVHEAEGPIRRLLLGRGREPAAQAGE